MTSDLTSGYGEVVITPPLGVELCGYGFYRGRHAETILDDLKARAVCISAHGSTVILIVCDLIGFDVWTADQIRVAIAAEYHIPLAHVLLACTHTHSGPASQFLHACGEMSPEYVRRLPRLISNAVWDAMHDRSPCEMTSGSEQAEPIGFNRRKKKFDPIDPTVSAVICRREKHSICIFSASCHPVTLGPGTSVSADWPGAAVKAMEKEGYRCLCFQGFCGDIDPVCNMHSWGAGGPDDLALYGSILRNHVLNIARNNQPSESPVLTAVEKRIALPLQIPENKEVLARQYEGLRFREHNEAFERFVLESRCAAEKMLEQFQRYPWRDRVPIQGMQLGKMSLIALPGEVFCEYGLKLRPQFSALMTVGYANGNTGYWPVRTAYDNPDDYAAYLAAKLYGFFPFSPALEGMVFDVCLEVLKSCCWREPSTKATD